MNLHDIESINFNCSKQSLLTKSSTFAWNGSYATSHAIYATLHT